MGFLKRLFFGKGEDKEEKKQVVIDEEINQEIYPICEKCGMEMKPDHFILTINNKKFHKQCLRQIRKEARLKAFNGR